MTTPHPGPGGWVEAWLSAPRISVYLAAAAGDRQRALDLYEWNTQLSSALLHDLAHLEVGIRNAYDQALTQHAQFVPHWTTNPQQVFAPVLRTKKVYDPSVGRRVSRRVDVNDKPRKALQRAISEAGGMNAPPGKIVAQLMFGFWRYLSSAAHEVPLWRPYLHHAFAAGTSRPDVDVRMGDLHELRNRVAHHEPLLSWNLVKAQQQLVELAGLISPDLAQHITTSSKVAALLASRP
ncbi:Abi family protein [Kribbella sp. NBC_00482]|uniref:Abi family protein n=1 Tax=Kribbella sp. NBC_00482 TaxID=2975968 RepID=UPI002E1803E8